MGKKFTHDEWQAFLIPFRKLLLNNDPANFFHVINILSRNGNRKDQLRPRKMKQNLEEAATSIGYGIKMETKKNGNWVGLSGKETLNRYLNTVIFYNNESAITQGRIEKEMHPFAIGAMFHYVIFTYKQALRVAGAIRLRHGI